MRHGRRRFLAGCLVGFSFLIYGAPLSRAASPPSPPHRENVSLVWNNRRVDAARGELLVRFKKSVPEARRKKLRAEHGLRLRKTLAFLGVDLVAIREKDSLEEAISELRQLPEVARVSPNFINELHDCPFPVIPDDIRYRQGLQSNLCQVRVDAAWNDPLVSNSRGLDSVLVAVLDSGVEVTHQDFGLTGSNPRFVVPGDFCGLVLGADCLELPCASCDSDGHGTHVAGIVGASTNNSIGVAGMTWYPVGVT